MAEIIINEFPGGKFRPGQYQRFVQSLYPELYRAYIKRGLPKQDADRFARYGTYQYKGSNGTSGRVNSHITTRNTGGIIKAQDGWFSKMRSSLKKNPISGLNNNITDVKEGYWDAAKFIKENINSPGFKHRLKENIKKGYISQKDVDTFNKKFGNNLSKLMDTPYLEIISNLGNAYAHLPIDNSERFDYKYYMESDDTLKNLSDREPNVVDWSYIMTHEFAHIMDTLLGSDEFEYSQQPNLIPKSNSYKQIEKVLNPDVQSLLKAPQYYLEDLQEYLENTRKANDSTDWGEKVHGSSFSETFADLWDLRKRLFDSGIYDSKSVTPITKEQLQKYKSKVPPNQHGRIFKEFNDDNIIWMLNNLAYNNNNSDLNIT